MNLRQALRVAARVAPAKSPIYITTYVLLEPADGMVRLRATDLSTQVDLVCEGEINAPLAVPARLLNSLVAATSEDLHLHVEHNVLHIESETFSLRVGGTKPEDFPLLAELKDEREVTFDREAFRWVIEDCWPDDSRPIMTGVALQCSTGAMCASDGFRLRISGEVFSSSNDVVVVPASVAKHLPPNCSKVSVNEAHTHIRFEGDWSVTAHLLQGTFPNFEQLIPPGCNWSIDGINRAAWLRALAPVLRIATHGSGIVRIEGGEGMVRLSARAEELGEASASLPANISGDLSVMKVALNGAYLLAALKGAAPELRLSGREPKSQVVFEYGSRREVIMPMFVEW